MGDDGGLDGLSGEGGIGSESGLGGESGIYKNFFFILIFIFTGKMPSTLYKIGIYPFHLSFPYLRQSINESMELSARKYIINR